MKTIDLAKRQLRAEFSDGGLGLQGNVAQLRLYSGAADPGNELRGDWYKPASFTRSGVEVDGRIATVKQTLAFGYPAAGDVAPIITHVAVGVEINGTFVMLRSQQLPTPVQTRNRQRIEFEPGDLVFEEN